VLLVQGIGEITVMTAATRLLLLHCAMDTGTDFCVVSTGNR